MSFIGNPVIFCSSVLKRNQYDAVMSELFGKCNDKCKFLVKPSFLSKNVSCGIKIDKNEHFFINIGLILCTTFGLSSTGDWYVSMFGSHTFCFTSSTLFILYRGRKKSFRLFFTFPWSSKSLSLKYSIKSIGQASKLTVQFVHENIIVFEELGW